MLLAPASLSVCLAISLFLSLELAVLVRSGLVKGKEGSCEVTPGTWYDGSCVPVASVLLGPRDNSGDQTCPPSTWMPLPGVPRTICLLACRWGEQSGQFGEMSPPATSALRLGETMPWLQATAGHSPDSDQSHRETCVMGDAGESVQGQERGVGPTGRPLGWAVLVSMWPWVALTPRESQFVVFSSNRATAFPVSGFQNLLNLSPCPLVFLTALSF